MADYSEEEFKEALRGYLFLGTSESGLTAAALDDAIETWFKDTYDARIEFEIEDALGKLKRLKLRTITGTDKSGAPVWTAVSVVGACERLNRSWDSCFQVHSPTGV